MEVRSMHSYALGSDSAAQHATLIDRLAAPPVRSVSKASSIGTVRTGFTCMISVSDKDRPQKNVFICGHSSGALYVWRRQRFHANADSGQERGPEAVAPSSAHDQLKDSRFIHKGPVTVLKMQPNTHFIYSGASDRDIKLWDIFDTEHPPCLRQTFSGHGGSITAIEFAPLMGQHPGYMITGSTDQKIIVWKNAEGREMMMYPFYIKMRVIDLKTWPTCLCFLSTTRLAQGDLYIGDSQGKIKRMIFEVTKTGVKETEPKVWSAGLSSHGLGIMAMVAEPQEGVMVSVANDICVKVWEFATGSNKKTLKNENRCRFHAVHVDSGNQDVFLVDDKGYLTVWNWISERIVFCQCLNALEPLLSVACNHNGTEVYVQSPTKIESYMIVRGMTHVALRGHTESIVGVGFVSPEKEDIYGDQDILYSCALDNTLRSWDPLSLECSFVMKETADTEMSCLSVLSRLCTILTGNDDGSLRLWDLGSGKHSVVKGHSNTISAMVTCSTGAHADDTGGQDLVFTCGFDGEVVSWEVVTTRIKNPAFSKSSKRADADKAPGREREGGSDGLDVSLDDSVDGFELSASLDEDGVGGWEVARDGGSPGGRGGTRRPATDASKEPEYIDASRKLSLVLLYATTILLLLLRLIYSIDASRKLSLVLLLLLRLIVE